MSDSDNLNCESFESQCMVDNIFADIRVCMAYKEFIVRNEVLFKNKIVLDVGCRSGILSLMAVEVGAAKVFAVGCMDSADSVSELIKEDDIGEEDGVFLPLIGELDEVELPDGFTNVDIIISEWMGQGVFSGSLFKDVIYARDKWLAKGGHIFPNVANFYIAGISLDTHQVAEKCSSEMNENDHLTDAHESYEPDVHDIDNDPGTLFEDYVEQEQLMTDESLIKSINLCTATKHDEFFTTEFNVLAQRDGVVHGFVLFFAVGVSTAKDEYEMLFSISPSAPRTYMKHTILIVCDILNAKEGEQLKGRLALVRNDMEIRYVELTLGKKISEEELIKADMLNNNGLGEEQKVNEILMEEEMLFDEWIEQQLLEDELAEDLISDDEGFESESQEEEMLDY